MAQDQPYGSVTTVGAAATFSNGMTGVIQNTSCIEITSPADGSRSDYTVSALAASGLTCTLTPTPPANMTNASFNLSGRQSSIRG